MNTTQRLGYNLVLGVIGLILGVAGFAFIYAHLRLGQFDSTLAQAELLFSSDAREEQELMENVRLGSGVVIALATPIGVVLSDRYYRGLENPQGELIMYTVMGIIFGVVGVGMYITAGSIATEASAILIFLAGILTVISNSIYLIVLEPDKD